MTSLSSWSPGQLRRHLMMETAIAVVIAVCLSDLFTWLLFGGRRDILLQSPKLIVDTFVQSFIVAFMMVLPSTLVVRRRLRIGAAPLQASWGRWPRNAAVRALVFAVPVAVGLTLLHTASAPALPKAALSLATLLVLKAALGAFVAAVVAPVAVRVALADGA